ncbi:MAG: YhjD/YihY/BrkB family envelope integrity protein [Pseudomonadota bacterium]
MHCRRRIDAAATFGALSAAVVMMLWLYYSTLIVVLGASINAELEFQTKVDTTTGPNQPLGERGAFVADRLPEQVSN